MEPHTASTQSLSALDWLGLVASAFGMLGLLVFPLIGAAFASMFEDFGAGTELPVLTRLATSAWFPVTLAVPVGATLAQGLRTRHPLGRRRLWIVAAFVLAGLSWVVCLLGVYLPIFAVANAIRAE